MDEKNIQDEQTRRVQEERITGIQDDPQRALLLEAIEYFRQNGFRRLLDSILKKYQGLGRLAGSVKLTGLSPEEQEALSSLFRRDFRHKASAVIRLQGFAQALEETKFGDIAVLSVLEGIYGRVLTYADALAEKEKTRLDFFAKLRDEYTGETCRAWLAAIEARQEGTRGVQVAYEKDAVSLLAGMRRVLHALTELEKLGVNCCERYERYERLPVFARRVAKNPHAFDPGCETGKLFINALTVLRTLEKGSSLRSPADCTVNLKMGAERALGTAAGGDSSEDIDRDSATPATLSGGEVLTELYYHFGLLRDDLWNFVTCSGLQAREQSGGELGVWSSAVREGAVLNVPLREMVKVAEVYPGALRSGIGLPNGDGRVLSVFVVENPAVFSTLLDEADKIHLPYPPLICTHGQFKLAALLLLDKLVAQGESIYYSGDFDPEGLLMAEALIQRYPGHVVPWRFSYKDYLSSEPGSPISELRLRKLCKVKTPELIPAKEEMLRRKKAGYQEGILALLWKDVKDGRMGESNDAPQVQVDKGI
ncbi:MAG: TIGR02679 family protein [Desulfitobacteriaceae bacterium]|nr:TIGR02679 family protein [Desulfitobacteriaceae bacterium]